ncbi:MAG: thioredoxin [Frankiales bacterium]|nr:thioredoxin [Frankiales bacterium]
MTRRQLIGFVVVLALIGAGLLLRGGGTSGAPSAGKQLATLRTLAALEPCPAGLGAGLPDLRLSCLGGGATVPLRHAGTGTPLLVNMWATWCGPCVREVPVLVAFAQKAGGKVAVVGIDSEDEDDKALTFARQYSMRYPSLVDVDGKVFRTYGAGLPITVLVDAAGRVVFTHVGELHSVADVQAMVIAHLGVKL